MYLGTNLQGIGEEFGVFVDLGGYAEIDSTISNVDD